MAEQHYCIRKLYTVILHNIRSIHRGVELYAK